MLDEQPEALTALPCLFLSTPMPCQFDLEPDQASRHVCRACAVIHGRLS
jgi:hypothetical protein